MERGGLGRDIEPARTPIRIRIQRLEAGGTSTGGSKSKHKRKRDEITMDTGKKNIVDFFMKKAAANLIRESGTNNKNQGATSSPLLGVSGSSASKTTSEGDTGLYPEERGREGDGGGKKRTCSVLGRWPYEANIQHKGYNKGGQEETAEDRPRRRKGREGHEGQ